MRVFVTGAGGFIGRNLLPKLAANGHEPVALLLHGEKSGGLESYRLERGDITRSASLRGILDGSDAVVHLAAAVGYGQTMEHCRRINTLGTRNTVEAAVAAGVRRFVHLSSVSVYGRTAGVQVSENAPFRKTGDPYGDSKIDAEELLQDHARRGEIDLTVLRPTVIYGPGDDKFLPKLVENLRSGRAQIVGRGDNRVDAIHVDDVVEFLCRVLVDPRAVAGIYNLNHPANPTWKEFVAITAQALGVPTPRRHAPYPLALLAAAGMELIAYIKGAEPRLTRYAVRVVGRPYHYSVDRAKSELGFEAQIDLREGVRREISA